MWLLKEIAKSTVWSILNDTEIKPHKVKYYLEKRDHEFEQKIDDVLIVYKQMEIQFETGNDNGFITLIYDGKPGI